MHTSPGMPVRRHRRIAAAGLTALATVLGLGTVQASPAAADTAPPTGTPATVSADALPTWQINGVVWAQVTVGDTVYATGEFTRARPPGAAAGSSEVERLNLLAYSISTGNLVTSFAHKLNARGLAAAASPDGTRVYVGGDFTSVDGIARGHIAAFDTATGALVGSFAPNITNTVRAIAPTNTTVYAGGAFFKVGTYTRTRLAAMSAATGVPTSWAPTADDNTVRAMVLAPDGSRVIVGGNFTTLNGVAAYGMGSVSTATGATLPWAANQTIRDATDKGGITALRTDGTQIYGSGYAFGAGASFEGTFAANPTTGAIIWLNDCHGDTYDVLPVGQVLYSVSHAHDCSPINGFPDRNPRVWYHALASTTYATGTNRGPDSYGWNYNGRPAADLLTWFPDLGIGSYTPQYQAAYSLTGNADYIALGGEFPTANGKPQQGLVRFAVRAAAPNRIGPVASAGLVPTVTSPSPGVVSLRWTSTYDTDNGQLTYAVLRDGSSTPVWSTKVDSRFWSLPAVTYTDTAVPAGSHTYRIRVTDPLGNTVTGGTSAAVTVAAGGNTAPTASFTASCTARACSVNGTGSTDPGGSIASWSWNFGDGATATGSTASHTYLTDGQYTITLTVTDNQGATGTTTRTVTVSSVPGQLASDDFARTVSGGWGTATLGGPWSASGSAANLSVTPGTGRLTVPAAGGSSGAYLGSVSSTSATTTATLAVDKAATGGGTYLYVVGRRVTSTAEYRARVRLVAGGQVTLSISKLDGSSTETLVAAETTLAGVTYAPGMQLRVAFGVTGTGPTTLRLTAWPATGTKPATPQLTATDSAASLQTAGSVGVRTYVSGSATNAPLVVSVSGLSTVAG